MNDRERWAKGVNDTDLEKVAMLVTILLSAAEGAGMTLEEAHKIHDTFGRYFETLTSDGHAMIVDEVCEKWVPYARSGPYRPVKTK
jgi:hypothetical protein